MDVWEVKMFWETARRRFASATGQRSCTLCLVCTEISGHKRQASRPPLSVLPKHGPAWLSLYPKLMVILKRERSDDVIVKEILQTIFLDRQTNTGIYVFREDQNTEGSLSTFSLAASRSDLCLEFWLRNSEKSWQPDIFLQIIRVQFHNAALYLHTLLLKYSADKLHTHILARLGNMKHYKTIHSGLKYFLIQLPSFLNHSWKFYNHSKGHVNVTLQTTIQWQRRSHRTTLRNKQQVKRNVRNSV